MIFMNKVLQISGTMNLGGQETFIMNLYRSIDKSKIQFDFVVNGQKKGFYEEEIEKMGGKIFHVTPMSKNVFKHFLEVRSIIKNNNYVAVHRHSSSAVAFVDLLAAKFCNINFRALQICHNTRFCSAPIYFSCSGNNIIYHI